LAHANCIQGMGGYLSGLSERATKPDCAEGWHHCYWHHSNQQVSGDEPSPNEHRHLHQGHARRAHVQDGDDDVDRTHDG